MHAYTYCVRHALLYAPIANTPELNTSNTELDSKITYSTRKYTENRENNQSAFRLPSG
jgi:hypothetical protein